MKVLRAFVFSLSVAALSAAPVAVFGQEVEPIPLFDLPDIAAPAGTVDCFDYYRFGSVQADFQPDVAATTSGTPLTFRGSVINTNEYPVVDGSLYVKIYRTQEAADKNTIGPELIDQFFVQKGLSLPAGGELPLEFTWTTPSYLPSGTYKLATFFVTADRFNLLGLTFTDDVLGNAATFAVTGEQTTGVQFDREAVTLNGTPYQFISAAPRVSTEPATIAATVTNTTTTAQSVPVTWQLFAWDGLRPDNLLDTRQETVAVAPGGSATTTYSAPHTAGVPVYYAVATARYQDTQSIIGVRFVRKDVERTRINFPAVDAYPLAAGEPTTLFACVHGMGDALAVPNNTLTLTVRDESGRTVHSYTYEGDITGNMMGVADTFAATSDLQTFTIAAELETDGQVVDSVTLRYDCAELGQTACANAAEAGADTPLQATGTNTALLWAVAAILLALLVILGIVIGMRKKPSSPSAPTPPTALFVLLVIGGLLLAAVPHPADAKSVSVTQMINKTLRYYGQRYDDPTNPAAWLKGLLYPTVSVQYLANITNRDTGERVHDGDVIPVGTRLRLQFTPHDSSHVYWVGTGHSSDTPYGEWLAGAEPPTPEIPVRRDEVTRNTCRPQDYLTTYIWTPKDSGIPEQMEVYIPLMVNPPTRSITDTDGLTCSALSAAGAMDCSATQAGDFSPAFQFGDTFGKFYYRYIRLTYLGEPRDNPPCIGSNLAMRELIGSELQDAFVLDVPTQTIPFTFQAATVDQSLQPPDTPVISGPVTGTTQVDYTFSVVATHPDGLSLRYGIDWNGDSTVDEWLPSRDDVVDPGTAQSFSHRWTLPGAKTFRVKARDTNFRESGWAQHTITLTESATSPTPAVTPTPTPTGTPLFDPGTITETE